MMPLSARQALERHISSTFNEVLDSFIKSKETGPDFYSMMIQLQKGTEDDFKIVADKYANIFLDGLDNYMENNHIVKYGHIPHDTRKQIGNDSAIQAIKDWAKEKQKKEA